jgi:hypothetical protein
VESDDYGMSPVMRGVDFMARFERTEFRTIPGPHVVVLFTNPRYGNLLWIALGYDSAYMNDFKADRGNWTHFKADLQDDFFEVGGEEGFIGVKRMRNVEVLERG